jgi:hypothetical protein
VKGNDESRERIGELGNKVGKGEEGVVRIGEYGLTESVRDNLYVDVARSEIVFSGPIV